MKEHHWVELGKARNCKQFFKVLLNNCYIICREGLESLVIFISEPVMVLIQRILLEAYRQCVEYGIIIGDRDCEWSQLVADTFGDVKGLFAIVSLHIKFNIF
jgi:hypothetical protein